jgi:hypothetical protein
MRGVAEDCIVKMLESNLRQGQADHNADIALGEAARRCREWPAGWLACSVVAAVNDRRE